ncbi:MAG: alpha/beta hydrolase-fold protein [Polyangiaceae bacterium]
MNRIGRRAFGSIAAAGFLSACSRSYAGQGSGSSAPSAAPAPSAPSSEWRTLKFEASTDQPEGQVAQVLVPPNSASLGTIIALHGKGESTKGLEGGAKGWQKDYELGRIHEKLLGGPIKSEDVKGFLGPKRLAKINASLSANPYSGLVVACPYAPNLGKPKEDEVQPYARFLISTLLPKVSEATGAPRDRARTGIDGVSMGGRLALLVGLSHPEVFSSVGALQPQIEVKDAEWLADLALRANQNHKVSLRLVSSDDDPFLDSVKAFSAALDAVGVAHQKVITAGPHDYIWNKGPGGCEMLVFHERVLRSLDPP